MSTKTLTVTVCRQERLPHLCSECGHRGTQYISVTELKSRSAGMDIFSGRHFKNEDDEYRRLKEEATAAADSRVTVLKQFPHRCLSCGKYSQQDLESIRSAYPQYRQAWWRHFRASVRLVGIFLVGLFIPALLFVELIEYLVRVDYPPGISVAAAASLDAALVLCWSIHWCWQNGLLPASRGKYEFEISRANHAAVVAQWLTNYKEDRVKLNANRLAEHIPEDEDQQYEQEVAAGKVVAALWQRDLWFRPHNSFW